MIEEHRWATFMDNFKAKWAIAPDCPFCGAGMRKLYSRWTTRQQHPSQLYRVGCLQCGAQGAETDTPEEAVDQWSRRTASSWQPLGPHSYVLPMQELGSLLVHDSGDEVSFIDWVEGDVHQQVMVKLGHFRICYRSHGKAKEKRDE